MNINININTTGFKEGKERTISITSNSNNQFLKWKKESTE
jgi:hypothetical protein